MAEEAKRIVLKLISCMVEATTFDEGDAFDEELSNPKGVKEIVLAISSLAILKPVDFLSSLKQLLVQVMAPEASQ